MTYEKRLEKDDAMTNTHSFLFLSEKPRVRGHYFGQHMGVGTGKDNQHLIISCGRLKKSMEDGIRGAKGERGFIGMDRALVVNNRE